jgi:hypothetical protein
MSPHQSGGRHNDYNSRPYSHTTWVELLHSYSKDGQSDYCIQNIFKYSLEDFGVRVPNSYSSFMIVRSFFCGSLCCKILRNHFLFYFFGCFLGCKIICNLKKKSSVYQKICRVSINTSWFTYIVYIFLNVSSTLKTQIYVRSRSDTDK